MTDILKLPFDHAELTSLLLIGTRKNRSVAFYRLASSTQPLWGLGEEGYSFAAGFVLAHHLLRSEDDKKSPMSYGLDELVQSSDPEGLFTGTYSKLELHCDVNMGELNWLIFKTLIHLDFAYKKGFCLGILRRLQDFSEANVEEQVWLSEELLGLILEDIIPVYDPVRLYLMQYNRLLVYVEDDCVCFSEFVAKMHPTIDELPVPLADELARIGELECIPMNQRTLDRCHSAVARLASQLKYVPNAVITQALCEQAVRPGEGACYEYVPEEFKTTALTERAIAIYSQNVLHAPRHLVSEAQCRRAIKEYRYSAFSLMPEEFKTPALCRFAIELHKANIEFVPENLVTPELLELSK